MSPLSSASAEQSSTGIDNDEPNGKHDSRSTPRAKTTLSIKEDESDLEADSATGELLPTDIMRHRILYVPSTPPRPPPNPDNMPPPTMEMLLALANMSATNMSGVHPAVQLPTSIKPSQMQLSTADSSDVHGNTPSWLNPGQDLAPVPTRLQSFARIEFADSEFQMTTYAVIIGRDQVAMLQARRDAKLLEKWNRKVGEAIAQGRPLPPQPPPQKPVRYSRSWYSEEGGMLGPESDSSDADPRPSKRRKLSLQDSGESSSLMQSAEEPAEDVEDVEDVDRQYVAHTPGAAVVDLEALRPSPSYVPKIGIHSPGSTAKEVADNTRAISRKHLRIEYDQRNGVFVATALHKNGFFCRDVFYGEESEGLVLRSGDHLQIKDVSFVFHINGVGEGETGAEPEPQVVTGTEPVVAGAEQEDTRLEAAVHEVSDADACELEMLSWRYSEGGKEMSFDFDKTHGDMPSTSEDEGSIEDEKADVVIMETIEQDDEAVKPELTPEVKPEPAPLPPKKRGPGRPPKNGIMSKREERDLKKKAAAEAAAEKAKTATPDDAGQQPPVKRKVGRPRKHPLPEDGGPPVDKRKYTPRKPKEDGTDGDKPQRCEKPKTPPLELDRSQYTEEQLAKPPKNYGILIDEVLPMAPEGLTLKQIYKRIQMKYPYYYFHVDTKGWESSVRHNLLGNDAFRKNEQTHLWSRVPGVDLDAGKKRRVTPPEVGVNMYQQQPYPVHQMQQANIQGQQLQTPVRSVQTSAQYPPQYPPQYPLEPVHMPPAMEPVAVQSTPHYMVQQPMMAQPTASHARGTPPYLPATATPPAALAPQQRGPAQPRPSVLPPDFVRSVTNFKETVTAQIRHSTSAPEAIALSAINRGMGLIENTLAPIIVLLPPGQERDEELRRLETIEKVVLGVFEATFSKHKGLWSGLIPIVHAFRQKWTKMLEPRLGLARRGAIIMSAVDRVLGLADHSVFQVEDSQRRELETAENMLMLSFSAELANLELAETQSQTRPSTVAAAAAGYAVSPTPAYTAPVPVTTASMPGAFAQTFL